MMSKIVMLPCAVKDLEDVVEYLSRFSLNAALKQYDRIISAVDKLKQFPMMCAVYDTASSRYVYRKLVVDDYLVFYITDGDIVEIHRILNGRRELFNELN